MDADRDRDKPENDPFAIVGREIGPEGTREATYAWNPRLDITVYDLARCMPALIRLASDGGLPQREFSRLHVDIQRNFRVNYVTRD